MKLIFIILISACFTLAEGETNISAPPGYSPGMFDEMAKLPRMRYRQIKKIYLAGGSLPRDFAAEILFLKAEYTMKTIRGVAIGVGATMILGAVVGVSIKILRKRDPL